MPNNFKITITNNGGVTKFTPNPVNIDKGDSVFWVNKDDRGDVDGAHQLGPVGGASKDWMQFPVLPGVGGETNMVFFPDEGTFPYMCFVGGHGDESGTIKVGSTVLT